MVDLSIGLSAAVLAGGLGTRLRSVVADRPKVLAPVAGRPFLAHLLDQLEEARVPETVLLVGFGAGQIRATLGARHGGMRLVYSAEPEPRGTAGALRLALPKLPGDNVLLLNGDSFCDVDLGELHCFHHERGGATMALARVENAARFGRARLGRDDRVVSFDEKDPAPSPGWINAGIYLMARRLLEMIAEGRAVSLEREVLPAWVAAGDLHGFRAGGRFIDIGVPDTYAAAEGFFSVLR